MFSQFFIVLRLMLSGVMICCRPMMRFIARRRIQREYDDKVRERAFAKAQQLEAERKKQLEEDALAAEFEAERTKHIAAASPKKLPVVAVPAHLAPKEVPPRAEVLDPSKNILCFL